ncbi:MAG: hypothetical protein ACXW38_09985 [Nitrospira sp.]
MPSLLDCEWDYARQGFSNVPTKWAASPMTKIQGVSGMARSA